MSEEKNKVEEEIVADDQIAADAEATEEDVAAAEAGEEAVEAEVVEDEEITIMSSEYEKLVAERRELQERMLRQQAEFDNVRKRLRKEGEEAGTRALSRFIRPLLTEMDNFEHALQAANPEAFQDFAMGVTMIRENILGIFNGAGIEVVPAEGIFNPALHEVVAQVENADEAKGTIIQVHRNGYKLGDQIVRSAQVVVAKPPEAAKEEPAAEDASVKII